MQKGLPAIIGRMRTKIGYKKISTANLFIMRATSHPWMLFDVFYQEVIMQGELRWFSDSEGSHKAGNLRGLPCKGLEKRFLNVRFFYFPLSRAEHRRCGRNKRADSLPASGGSEPAERRVGFKENIGAYCSVIFMPPPLEPSTME